MPTIEECAAAMDDVARSHCDLFGAGPDLVKRFEDKTSAVVIAAACALDYLLHPLTPSSERRAANPFVPAFGHPEEHFQWLKETDDGATFRLWAELAVHVRNPVVAARLHDLLWVMRYGDKPHAHAHAAIEAYLRVAEQDSCAGHPALHALRRARSLAMLLKTAERLPDIAALGGAQFDRERRSTGQPPDLHILTASLRLLAELPSEHRPADLGDKIAVAHEAFGDRDILGRDVLFEIEQDLAQGDSDRIQQVKYQATHAWAAEAERREGWHRAHALEQVEQWAQGTENAGELVARARRARQEMESNIFQWAEIDASVDIPAADIERDLMRIVGMDDLESALRRFGGWGPPTGNLAEIESAVDREMQTPRLIDLIPHTLHHPAGFEVKTFSTPAEQRDYQIKMHQELHVRISGALSLEALMRIGATYERRWGQLLAFFSSDMIRPSEALAVSRGFEHFWAGRYDEAILVSLPRIESILRGTARAMGEVVFRPPEADRPGGLKTLGEVLRLLRGKIDEGWRQSFWFVLADPTGLNLRNEYSHGLRDVGEAVDAALVLQIAAHLRLRTLEPTTGSPEQSAGGGS